MTSLKKFDIFPKFNSEFERDARDKTVAGAFLSIFAIVCVAILFIGEVTDFLSVESKHELYVDTDIHGTIPVTVNITFNSIPCNLISIDALDSFGDEQEEFNRTTQKTRVYDQGEPLLGSADEISNPSQCREGCNIHSTMHVKRVQGKILFLPGRILDVSGRVHEAHFGISGQKFDLSHHIHQLRFGQSFPGQRNPLHGAKSGSGAGGGKFEYFVKVVPTRFDKLSSGLLTLETNQYSVTEHFTPFKQEEYGFVHGVFLVYDLSPIKVHIFEERPYRSMLHLAPRLCAIGGGVFTVLGIIDAVFYHGVAKIKRNMQIGGKIC